MRNKFVIYFMYMTHDYINLCVWSASKFTQICILFQDKLTALRQTEAEVEENEAFTGAIGDDDL